MYVCLGGSYSFLPLRALTAVFRCFLFLLFAPPGCIMQCNLRTTQGNVLTGKQVWLGSESGLASVWQPQQDLRDG